VAGEAEGGVEATTGTCGARPYTTVKRRKWRNVNHKRVGLIATTVDGAPLSFEPGGRGRARREENSAALENNAVPIPLGCCCTCGARIGGTLLGDGVHETSPPNAYSLMDAKFEAVEKNSSDYIVSINIYFQLTMSQIK